MQARPSRFWDCTFDHLTADELDTFDLEQIARLMRGETVAEVLGATEPEIAHAQALAQDPEIRAAFDALAAKYREA